MAVKLDNGSGTTFATSARLMGKAGSWRFDSPSTDFLLTMACWIKPARAIFNKWLTIDGAGGGTGFFGLASTNASVVSFDASSPLDVSLTGGTASPDVWTPIAGVSRASNDRELYVDGVSVGTSSSDITGSNVLDLDIGATQSFSEFGDGCVAEVAIWDVPLPAILIKQMALRRLSPLMIRPDRLLIYAPLWTGDWHDYINDYRFDEVNDPKQCQHPPIVYPTGFRPGIGWRPANIKLPVRRRYVAPAAVGDPMPMAMHYYRTRRSG